VPFSSSDLFGGAFLSFFFARETKGIFCHKFPLKKKNCPQKSKSPHLQHEKLLFEIVLTFILGLHAAMHYDQLIN